MGTKEEQYVGNHFDCRIDFDAGRRSTQMATQPGLGIFPERRPGARLSNPDRLNAFRSTLDPGTAASSRYATVLKILGN